MTGRQLIELLIALKCRMKVALAGQGMHQTGQEIVMTYKRDSRKLCTEMGRGIQAGPCQQLFRAAAQISGLSDTPIPWIIKHPQNNTSSS